MTPTGAIDSTFGLMGYVRDSAAVTLTTNATLVSGTGDVLLAGSAIREHRQRAALAGYSASAASFANGIDMRDWSNGNDAITAAIPSTDGRLLVTGKTWSATTGSDVILARLRRATP